MKQERGIPFWFKALHFLQKFLAKPLGGKSPSLDSAYRNYAETSEDRFRTKEMKGKAFSPSEKLWIAMAFAVLIGTILLS